MMRIFSRKLTNRLVWRPESTDMAWRVPNENLATYSQLVVNETQEALLFKDGEMIKAYGPGRYTLDTRNLPLAHNLNAAPFGANPFLAEIYYFHKIDFKAVPFRTDMFRYHDPDYRIMLPLVCKGNYGVKIVDSAKFLKKLLGSCESFTVTDLTKSLKAELSSEVSSLISTYMQQRTIGVQAISSYLATFSRELLHDLLGVFSNYGLSLLTFHVNSLDVDESREDGREILQALTAQSAQAIAGYSWQQKQAFDLADKQLDVAENVLDSNSQMGILGAMMLTMGGGRMHNNITPAMMQTQSSLHTSEKSAGQKDMSQAPEMIFCSKCAKKYPSTSKFCPYCGDIYNPCPFCGYDNNTTAVKCVKCGGVLEGNDASGICCPECKHPVNAAMEYCANCGAKLQRTCSRCKTPIKPGQAFCPSCGKKV